MNNMPIVVLITAPSLEVAHNISNVLLQKRLAACVNILPTVNSLFIWQDKVADEKEVLMVVKSKADFFEERLIPAVQEVHPYQVPEIIALPIAMGLKSYLDWIDDVTA